MFDCRSLFGEKGIMKKLTNAMGVAFFGLVAVWMFCLSLVSDQCCCKNVSYFAAEVFFSMCDMQIVISLQKSF